MFDKFNVNKIFISGVTVLGFAFVLMGTNLREVIIGSNQSSQEFSRLAKYQNNVLSQVIIKYSKHFLIIDLILDDYEKKVIHANKNIIRTKEKLAKIASSINKNGERIDSELSHILNDLKEFEGKILSFERFISEKDFRFNPNIRLELQVYKIEYHRLLERLSIRGKELILEKSFEEKDAIKELSQFGLLIFLFGAFIFIALAYFLSKGIRKLEREKNEKIKTNSALEKTQAIVESRKVELEVMNDNLQKVNQFKSEFLANMSHEIRTPMNGVLGMTQLLCESGLNPEQLNMAQTIQSCGDSLLIIINDILDYSKMESGKLELEIGIFNLDSFIEDTLFLFSVPAARKGVVITKEIGLSVPKSLKGDVTRIRQVISNLISNAIKFTSTGGEVKISISSIPIDDNSIKLVFNVIDSGIGIKEENQDKLFKAFTQADLTTTRKFGGTGLGLAICSKLTKLMGGEITLDSKFGVGTTMGLIVPLTVANEELSTIPIKERAPVNYLLSEKYKHKILVVEDNSVNQKLATMMLKKLGYSCDIAANGIEALDSLNSQKESKYTLIFMDMMMPEMDGLTATREIIKKYGNDRAKIVAMTANAFKEDKDKCIEAGMDDYMAKPIKMSELEMIITKYSESFAATKNES